MVRHNGGVESQILINCGWGAVGTPREVNNKIKIHKRHCEACKNTDFINIRDKDDYKFKDGIGDFKKTKNGNLHAINRTGTIYQGNKYIVKKTDVNTFSKDIY